MARRPLPVPAAEDFASQLWPIDPGPHHNQHQKTDHPAVATATHGLKPTMIRTVGASRSRPSTPPSPAHY